MLTKEERSTLMAKIMDNAHGISSTLLYLYYRWQDEKGHEDFRHYQSEIRLNGMYHFPEGTKFKSFTKNFELTVIIPGFPYEVVIYINSKEIGWKSGKTIQPQ